MIIRWICKKCNKKWIYPIDKCSYCNENIEKEIGIKMKVVGITKVSIPSPLHPIIPYNVLMLEDENGNKMPKKVMSNYKIGDNFSFEKSSSENAVSIVKLKYDFDIAVKQAIELVGGLELKAGMKILIKPSVIAGAYPYQGITTNPKVIEALLNYLFENGVKKEDIAIAEQVLFGDSKKAGTRSGIGKLISKYGIKYIDLRESEFALKEDGEYQFEIAKDIFDFDIIINIPVMKTHMLLGMSGALENMTRCASAVTITALQEKANEAIGHMQKIIPKYFTLGDATIGLQGNGPVEQGEPGFLLLIMASKDPVALDKVFGEICLLKKAKHVEYAGEIGVGMCDLSKIDICGEELKAVQHDVKQPIGSKLIKNA